MKIAYFLAMTVTGAICAVLLLQVDTKHVYGPYPVTLLGYKAVKRILYLTLVSWSAASTQ